MSRNIQEYLNGLVNKNKIFYLDLNNNTNKPASNPPCPNCNQPLQGKLHCNNCRPTDKQLEGEITDLDEFTNLRGISASNNQFTHLDFLDTLPNKDKLKSLNLFGNQITEIDFAWLFSTFPNLEKINLTGNPLSAKNLDNLSKEQFAKLINGIQAQTIKINAYKGTILMDLLAHAQQLASQGQSGYNAHIQTLTQMSQPAQPKQETPDKGNNTPLLVGGLVVLGISAVAIGYLWGKNRKRQETEL